MISEITESTQPYEVQAQLLKVLTHPARLAILDLLRDGEHCVCHLEAHLGYRQAYISQQLAVLREAGLIVDRRDGWNIYYKAADPRIYAILDAVQGAVGNPARPAGLRPAREREAPAVLCPCPHCREARGESPAKETISNPKEKSNAND